MVHSLAVKGDCVWACHNHKLYRFERPLRKTHEVDIDLGGIIVAENGSHIAGIAAGSKQVTILESENIEKVTATHEFPKRPSAISISNKDLVVSDKFGDVFNRNLFESSTTSKNTEPILGHVSMVLDVKFASPDFIVSSDRDEHIRISRFPKSFVIERFLLGHESFVSHLVICGSYLLSAGGDPYILAWNWQTGERIARLDVDSNVISMAAAEKTAYIVPEGTHEVLKVSIPSLQLLERTSIGEPVLAVACDPSRCFAGLTKKLIEIGGANEFEFELPEEEETYSEKHLKKRE